MTADNTPTPAVPGAMAMTEERLAEKLDGLVREASQTKLVACHAKSSKYITTIEGHGGGIAYTCCGDADQQNADADLIEALWNNSQTIIAALRELTRLRAQVREGDGVRYWLEQICAIATEPRANVGPSATHKELQDALRKIRELSELALTPQPAPTEGGKP